MAVGFRKIPDLPAGRGKQVVYEEIRREYYAALYIGCAVVGLGKIAGLPSGKGRGGGI